MERILDLIARYRCRSSDASLFDVYAFADYSGAVRDTKVVLAVAVGSGAPMLASGVRRRSTLLAAFRQIIGAADRRGLRVILGQDHQYGIPIELAAQLSLPTNDWRSAMRALFVTGELAPFAQAGEAGKFAAAANAWLETRGSAPYFWSATKSYGIPRLPPRPRAHPTVRRLTEVDVACAFDRVGDNGTVGGQTIVGIPRLLELLNHHPDIRVWPFDGLHVGAFERSHLMAEPYPSKVRAEGIAQTDANDAIACVMWAQSLDRRGALAGELDLRRLSAPTRSRVRFEGWIAGVKPE